jgi:large subunit ribosomal protein L5
MKITSRLKDVFNNEIKLEMMKELGFTNIHEVPTISKVVLSMGFDTKTDYKKNQKDLSFIAGQHAVLTKSTKSIAQFAIREGAINGAMVTLRGHSMYNFLDILVNIGLLNWREFMGLNRKSFNNNGVVSYSFGVKDTRIFPGINNDKMQNEGFNVTIVSNCKKSEHLEFIMTKLGFPFRSN